MFKRTLLSLTTQYSLLLLLLFTLFSGAIYQYMDYTFGGDYKISSSEVEPTDREPIVAAEVADAGLDRLRNGLIISYLVLVGVVPLVSFLLARRALKPIQKSFEDQQKFVDNASHELRTPLSVVQGELELAVSRKRTPAAYQQAIGTSLEELNRTIDLIAQLLLMARGSHIQIHEFSESIQLNTLVETCVIKMRKLYADKKLTINTELETCQIHGVTSLLTQVVTNVLDNAAKFSPRHSHITVKLICAKERVSITISDNGPGMTKEQIEKAFLRFWRADSARTIKGFGLGLPIVQQIIELHHGNIKLHSNKGMTVVIILPKTLSR